MSDQEPKGRAGRDTRRRDSEGPSAEPARRSSNRPARGRSEILRAAIREFAEKGYDGATTAGIARAARVTQPLVHHHFSSKELLWRAVLDELYSEVRAMQEQVAFELEGLDARAKLAVLLRQYILLVARRPELARLAVMSESQTEGPYQYLVENYLEPRARWLDPLFEEAQASGFLEGVDLRLLQVLVVGASVYPFLVPESAKTVYGLDVRSGAMAQAYADLVVRTFFHGLGHRKDEDGSKKDESE